MRIWKFQFHPTSTDLHLDPNNSARFVKNQKDTSVQSPQRRPLMFHPRLSHKGAARITSSWKKRESQRAEYITRCVLTVYRVAAGDYPPAVNSNCIMGGLVAFWGRLRGGLELSNPLTIIGDLVTRCALYKRAVFARVPRPYRSW